jgi:WD40 repeat protein
MPKVFEDETGFNEGGTVPLSLKFGYEMKQSYQGHKFPIMGVVWNPNSKCYVSYSKKHIHCWTKAEGKQLFKLTFFDETNSHALRDLVYSPSLFNYFVVSDDIKLHLFNE